MSVFRKLAPHLWGAPGDPSTGAQLELRLDSAKKFIESQAGVTWLGLLLLALKKGVEASPQLNSRYLFGAARRRKDFSVSLMVPEKTADLAFVTMKDLEKKSATTIESELSERLQEVRDGKPSSISGLYKLVPWIPWPLLPLGLWIFKWMKALELPFFKKVSFGSFVVSNVGSLGYQSSSLPLVPFYGASVMVAWGKMEQRVLVEHGEPKVFWSNTVSFTFDHRLADGYHGKLFLKSFLDVFENPQNHYQNTTPS